LDLRIDLFLKLSRLVKRRSLAQEICRQGLVTLNNRPVPPARRLKEGDQISIRTPRKLLTVKVLHLPQRGKPGNGCYEIVSQEWLPEEELI